MLKSTDAAAVGWLGELWRQLEVGTVCRKKPLQYCRIKIVESLDQGSECEAVKRVLGAAWGGQRDREKDQLEVTKGGDAVEGVGEGVGGGTL